MVVKIEKIETEKGTISVGDSVLLVYDYINYETRDGEQKAYVPNKVHAIINDPRGYDEYVIINPEMHVIRLDDIIGIVHE